MCFNSIILFIPELNIVFIKARDLKDKRGEAQGPVPTCICLSLSHSMIENYKIRMIVCYMLQRYGLYIFLVSWFKKCTSCIFMQRNYFVSCTLVLSLNS